MGNILVDCQRCELGNCCLNECEFRVSHDASGGGATEDVVSVASASQEATAADISATNGRSGRSRRSMGPGKKDLTEEELLAKALVVSKNEADQLERARIRHEQDFEYEESLRIDQQRELAKAVRRKEEEELERVKAEEAKLVVEAEAKRKAYVAEIIAEAKRNLEPEPPQDAPGRVELQLRLPDGRRLKRAFWSASTMEQVYIFTNSEIGEALAGEEYTLVSAMPRRVYQERGLSLQTVGLEGKCTLLVEVL